MSDPDVNQKRLNLKPGDYGHLSDLKRGQKAIVIDFHNNNAALRRHLLDMGITKGDVVEVKKVAPWGDPIDIKVRGYELAIRRDDMKGIDIQVLGK